MPCKRGNKLSLDHHTLIQRAGRIIRPAGKLILSMNSNQKLENGLLHALGLLKTLGA